MDDASAKVIDLIFGRWRSQILYAGVKLGVFDALASGPKHAVQVAHEFDVDAGMLYRLMRALGSLELLTEDNTRTFSLAPMGELLCRDHPHTLRGTILLTEGPAPYAAWKHLPALITDGGPSAGRPTGFVREFSLTGWEYMVQHPSHAALFNEVMSYNSSIDSQLVLEALAPYDFSRIVHLCDVGGGYSHTLCSLLVKYPTLKSYRLVPYMRGRRDSPPSQDLTPGSAVLRSTTAVVS